MERGREEFIGSEIIVPEVMAVVRAQQDPTGVRFSTDLQAVARILGVNFVKLPPDILAAGMFIDPDTIAIHPRYLDEPADFRTIAFHEAGHLMGWRLNVAEAGFLLTPQVATCLNEVVAGHIERLMLIPPSEFHRYFKVNRGADNFEMARDFEVGHDVPTQRITEMVSSPWTRDERLDLDAAERLLARSHTRTELLASGRAEQFLHLDPPVRKHLVTVTDGGLLSSIERALRGAEPSRGKGEQALRILRRSSTAEIMFFFDQYPLEFGLKVIKAMEMLDPPYNAIAVAELLTKLNAPLQALARLAREPLVARCAEGLCVRAQALKKAHPDSGGAKLAESCLRAAIELDPELEEAYTLLANVLLAQRRVKEALQCLDRPGDERVRRHYFLGKAWEVAGDKVRAAQQYSILIRTPDTFAPKARVRLARILSEQKRYDEAAEHYNQVLACTPYHVKALRGLTELLLAQAKSAEAAQALLLLVRFSPLQAWCYQSLGELFQAEGRERLAEPMFKQASMLQRINASHERAASEGDPGASLN